MPDYRSIMKKIEQGAPPDRHYYWSCYKTVPNETIARCDLRKMDGWEFVNPKDPEFAKRFGKEVSNSRFTPGRIRLNAENRIVIGDLVLMETNDENYNRRRQESIDNANLPMKRLGEGGHVPSQYLSEKPTLETKRDDTPTRSHTPAVASQ